MRGSREDAVRVRSGRKDPVNTFVLDVTLAKQTISVEVERKAVRNFNLRVRRDGTLYMSMPRRASRAGAQRFLDNHATWIDEHLAARVSQRAMRQQAANTLVQAVPLWGTLVPTSRVLGGAPLSEWNDAAQRALEEFYRLEVQRVLPQVVKAAEARVGVHATNWQVRRMTSRWGSCTPARKSIRISLSLAAYPPACLKMVVAHELVHLIEPSHNAQFHQLLDTACPQNHALSKLLKQDAVHVAQSKTVSQ